ncbi:MAG TPA: hypothetical protein PLB00_10385 [Pseudomonadota bacterium]|jgi:hypothetical protein|nr:hypothetical protein [Pseudomonadota bacterium]
MSTPRNIENFNRIVAQCLLQLYEAFPVPKDLEPSDIAMKALPDLDDQETLFKAITEVSPSAIEWLAAEGFVRYRADHQCLGESTIPQAQLTMKGLAILGTTPDSVMGSDKTKTLAEMLREGVSEGVKSSASAATGTILKAAMGQLFKFAISAAL